MLRLTILPAGLASLAVALTLAAAPLAVAPVAARAASAPAAALPASRDFTAFHLRGGGFRSRHSFFGGYGRSRSRRGIVHRVARTLFFAYLLHLFFSHGGLSILLWVIIIAVVLHLFRRRRRRYAY